MKKILLTSTVLAVMTLISFAGPHDDGNLTDSRYRSNYRSNDDVKNLRKPMIEQDLPYLFNAHESSVDLFATHTFTDSRGLYNDGFGGGLGLNHFFTRYIGLGFEGYAWDGSARDGVGVVDANLILRYPIEKLHIAPYIFGGLGGHFGPESEVSAQAGLGLEYRFNPNVGIFSDARYVAVDNQNDYFLPRLGLRFNF